MRCPGQDRRYWTEDAVFEVPCPQCDRPVELFKDESTGRCPGCGHRFRNPRTSFDCAQWCAYAEECLGFVPERKAASDPGQGAVASRLIQAIKDQLRDDPPRLARALRSFQYAREFLLTEGGDPRVIFAASLLLHVAEAHAQTTRSSESGAGEAQRSTKATQVLRSADVGLDEDTIACVGQLIESFHAGRELDTIEFRVVQDAHTLTQLAAADLSTDPESLKDTITNRLKTPAAKSKARALYRV